MDSDGCIVIMAFFIVALLGLWAYACGEGSGMIEHCSPTGVTVGYYDRAARPGEIYAYRCAEKVVWSTIEPETAE